MGANITVGGSLMHAEREPDFSGYATKAGIKCSDGRTILPDAFKHQDKVTVPLVWHHNHDDPANVLGHAVLENREDGVYTYGYFNDTEAGKQGKALVQHKDISQLSIFANQLVEKAKNVIHGMIREVSLVMAGANPGAMIDYITVQHDDGGVTVIDDEAVITMGLELEHASPSDKKPDMPKPSSDTDPTVQEIYDGMSDEEKAVVHYFVGAAVENIEHDDTKPDDTKPDEESGDEKEIKHMSRNVFDQTEKDKEKDAPKRHLLKREDIEAIKHDAMRQGSLKAAVEDYALKHGIENIDILFPDARAVMSTPEFDSRRVEWVKSVLNGTKHTPFSRIKTLSADITQEEARAKGYIKGTFKKEEWFGLTKRTTTPSTVYKKQQLDRDDILDITDFDVVAWLKAEMRLMLDEEIARAILIGDGRAVDDEDKIKDPVGAGDGVGIRSILHENDLYAATVNVNVDDANSNWTEVTDGILSHMSLYKGSGSPTFYTTLGTLTKMLLIRDGMGRRLYRTPSDIAAELGVSGIETVEVMEDEPDLVGIIVNLSDYTVGADRGGDITMFDDFDIDYNQYKYLIETRLSGALTKIRSAIIVKKVAGTSTIVTPVSPTFNETTGVLTPPTTTGVVYKRADTNAVVTTGSPITLSAGQSLKIFAEPAAGKYFDDNVHDEWTFKRPSA